MLRSATLVALPVIAAASVAQAGITITQGSSAPTYSSTLNFDEVGGATGLNVPANAFASRGVSSLVSGEGSNSVQDHATLFGVPGLGTGNSFYGPFGIFMQLSQDATEMSFQYWDTSGPASPFGGGIIIAVINDGDENNAVISGFSPAWGGNTNSWYTITTTDGSTFDEVRLIGNGFFPESVADNFSWNNVPAPGSLSLLVLGGAAALRRRRR